MGYYTYYSLELRNQHQFTPEQIKAAALKIAEKIGYDHLEDYYSVEYPFDFISEDSMKWYECTDDMTEISREFPDMIFVIYGEGEERDDIWRCFFHNGDSEYQRQHSYYDPEPGWAV